MYDYRSYVKSRMNQTIWKARHFSLVFDRMWQLWKINITLISYQPSNAVIFCLWFDKILLFDGRSIRRPILCVNGKLATKYGMRRRWLRKGYVEAALVLRNRYSSWSIQPLRRPFRAEFRQTSPARLKFSKCQAWMSPCGEHPEHLLCLKMASSFFSSRGGATWNMPLP